MPSFRGIRQTRRGGSGAGRGDDPYGVSTSRDLQNLVGRARSQGGRILTNPNEDTFHIVSPSGRKWGTYERNAKKFTGGDLSPFSSQANGDLYDITDELDGK